MATAPTIPQDAAPDSAALPQDPETIQDEAGISDELKEELANRCKSYAESDLYPRRMELMQAREQRYFWRGMQRLLWDAKSLQWKLVWDQPARDNNADQPDLLYETNIYTGYGRIVCSALSTKLPSIHFEPQDPLNSQDISTAKGSESLKLIVERNNRMQGLLNDALRFLWTDGRAAFYTYSDEETQTECIEVYGSLEVKAPILANCLDDCHYLALALEKDIAIMKAKYPDMADEIDGAKSIGSGESEYERIARIAVKQGTRLLSQAGDTLARAATWTRYWLRPAAFYDIQDEDLRQQALDAFPNGCRVSMVGQKVAEIVPESMDDHWRIVHALSGDGMHRMSLGQPLVSVQKRLNDLIDLAVNVYNYTVPTKWVNQELIDVQAMQSGKNAPGEYVAVEKNGQTPIGDDFFVEPTIDVPPSLIQMIQELKGEIAQFLVGAFPALFGVQDTGETASGFAMQRNQALGVQGQVWRILKEAYADIMKQAVICAANNRAADISEMVPGQRGTFKPVSVKLADMQGNIHCFPEASDAFPVTWDEKSTRYQQLVIAGDKNPQLAAILAQPDNMAQGLDWMGLPEIVIPQVEDRDKQLEEIDQLLSEVPVPNPAVAQAAMALQGAVASGQPIPPEAIQAAQAIPPEVSSVQIDPQFDDHAVHYAECKRFITSADGRKAERENPDGLQNVKLHAMAHFAELQKAQQGGAGKPPAESIAYKDLPPSGQVQMAQQAGIQLTPQDVMIDQMQDTQAKLLEAHVKTQGKPQGNAGPPQQ